MELVGYVMALVVGVCMGLLGGGGSILAVPILAYLFLLDEKVATAYSLFIVGATALVGGVRQNQSNNVDWNIAIVFGIPAVLGVWLVRHFLIPALPDILFTTGGFEFTRRMAMFGLFSLLMLIAAYAMITDKEPNSGRGNKKFNYPLILAEGLGVGALTGFVGAGGGFLIIPALVILANLEMKKAIGTSLIIIALKSLIGFFLGDALTIDIAWSFLLTFTLLAVVGIFLGIYIGKYIKGEKLQKGFGYFIIVMAIFIFTMEFIVN